MGSITHTRRGGGVSHSLGGGLAGFKEAEKKGETERKSTSKIVEKDGIKENEKMVNAH